MNKKQSKAKKHVVCGIHRSGSSFLCELINNCNAPVKNSGQIYSYEIKKAKIKNIQDIKKFFETKTTSEKTVSKGYKLTWLNAENISQELKNNNVELSPMEVAEQVTKGKDIIFLSRENKILQAISWHKMRETESWNSTVPAVRKSKYNYKEIKRLMQLAKDHEKHWKYLFRKNSNRVYSLTYEKLTANPIKELKRILLFLEVPVPDKLHSLIKFKKQRNKQTTRWNVLFRIMFSVEKMIYFPQKIRKMLLQ